MSLNGLDAPHVHDAYQTAVAEASGWLLLKYTSRDAVDLLAHGRNGVAEARNAIKDYTEASPLYGLIVYRRRRILIKYLPEGTSRLLQARTSVHLQDVLERFSPYETLLEISSADALNDTSLASSFQLHTASPSPSASRLDEIREDGEDSGPAPGQPSSARNSSNMSAAQRYKTERRIDQLKRKTDRAERSASPLRAGDASPVESPARLASQPPPVSKPSMAQYLVHEEQGQTSVTRLEPPLSARSMTGDSAPAVSTKSEASTAKAAIAPDSASQTTLDAGDVPSTAHSPSSSDDLKQRYPSAASPLELDYRDAPSTSMSGRQEKPALDDDDPYDLRKYDEWFKPKVKLGPRPVNSADGKNRPTTARVSALPANFKPATKKQEPARPMSVSSKGSAPATPVAASIPTATPAFNYAPPPIPDVPEYDRRPGSRGSIKSTPSHRSTMMTPDKLRLMKAIEHRKKQMRKSRDQQFMKPPIPEDVPEVPEMPSQITSSEVESGAEQQTTLTTDSTTNAQPKKADSGIAMNDDNEEQRQEQSSAEPPELSKIPECEPETFVSQETAKELALPPVSDDRGSEVDSSAEKEEENTTLPKVGERSLDPIKETLVEVESTVAVPTIVMADGSRPMTSEGPVQQAKDAAAASGAEEPISEDESATETLEPPLSPRRQNSDLAKRRRGFVEPLQIEVHSGNPDDFASDDDEFLDELHSATVQEAKPIHVARSPVTNTLFTRRPSADTLASVRSVNIKKSAASDKSPSETPPDGVSPEPVRSPSPSRAASPVDKSEAISARNVSSGISKRIQLLTDMTNREVNPAINLQSRPLTPEYSPNPFIQHDQRGRKGGAPRPRPTSFRRHSGARSGQNSAVPTPVNENAPTWSVQHDPATNRNSISVSARIIRPNVGNESPMDGEVSPTDSEMTINRRRVSRPDPLDTTASYSNVSSPAMSPIESRASSEMRTLHSATSRLGRRRQNSAPNGSDMPAPPRALTSSSGSIDESVTSKDGGRTSRFFKRISNFGGPKRKNSSQPASSAASVSSLATITAVAEPAETSKPSQRMSMAPDTPPAVVVGDLNVQFPDSLLWKRRIVTIDETGHLQFAIAHAMEIHKGVAQKRYPLTEFLAPFAPDLDSQELPHSVVLELHDGTALQAACEDAMTQRQVLHLLRTYWKAWNSLGV